MPDGEWIDTGTPGTFTLTVEAIGWAGNVTTRTITYEVLAE